MAFQSLQGICKLQTRDSVMQKKRRPFCCTPEHGEAWTSLHASALGPLRKDEHLPMTSFREREDRDITPVEAGSCRLVRDGGEDRECKAHRPSPAAGVVSWTGTRPSGSHQQGNPGVGKTRQPLLFVP